MSSYSSSEDERLSDAESSVSSSSHVEVSNQGSRKRRKLDQPNGEEEPKQPAKPFASISRIKAKPPTSREASTNNGSSSNGLNNQDKNTFADLGVDPWLVSALASMAIKKPTGIQRESIPEILKGRDAIGGSRTGSGKTVSFAVPILQAWARDPIGIFAVILTPTRELALQIFEQVNALGAPQGVKPLLVTGGSSLQDQAIALGRRPHIVIATPGRLADHIINSGEDTICGLRKVHYVVLDEADRLLASGPGSMLPDVETCLGVLPPATQRQTLLFTATVTPEVRALKDMPRAPGKPPVFLCEIDKEDLAIPTTLQQKYIQVPVTYREPYLHTLLSTPENESKSIMIFCNRTSTANLLEHLLRSLGHRVTSLHSGLPQPSRIANLARFRAKAARILVATDVASRGLDIPEVAMVIHYDVPRDPDDYIHRSGRTARAGRSGVAVTFIGQRDVELVLAIEERVGRKMEEYHEEGVSIEGRVVREALKTVSEKKREAMLQIEEGRDVKGKRKKGLVKKAKK